MKQVRQGDVMLVAVELAPPPGLTPKQEVILAEGELTGHVHRLTAPAVFEWEVNGQRYVQVKHGDGLLSHEDHDRTPIPVLEPNTTYRVVPQREWDLSNQWRKVVD